MQHPVRLSQDEPAAAEGLGHSAQHCHAGGELHAHGPKAEPDAAVADREKAPQQVLQVVRVSVAVETESSQEEVTSPATISLICGSCMQIPNLILLSSKPALATLAHCRGTWPSHRHLFRPCTPSYECLIHLLNFAMQVLVTVSYPITFATHLLVGFWSFSVIVALGPVPLR